MADDPNEDDSWLYGNADADAETTETSTKNATDATDSETTTTTSVAEVGADGSGGSVQASVVTKRVEEDIDQSDNFMVISNICNLTILYYTDYVNLTGSRFAYG